MSKRFLTRLAGGVALGSAALLLGTPAAALAAPFGYPTEPGASDRSEVVCATNEQSNRALIAQIISDNTIRDSDVTFDQSATVEQTNDNRTQPNNVVVCIGDLDVDVDVE
ncbi:MULTISPECIES: hypothetical protein [unclassified Micromonospora]|uniref:hypothetical protein n=1 Tax=unclassified Micromonospora TaxID=2617518 RepID=UPI0033212002